MIRWMAGHPVAANLLMTLILVGGALSVFNIKQEIFPEFEVDRVNVSVAYAGATPAELEESIVIPIENAIRGIQGVKRIRSNAPEGSATIRVDLEDGADVREARDEIERTVSRLGTLPEDAETPEITITKIQSEVLNIVVFGDAPRRSLLKIAQTIRDELLNHPDVSQVVIEATRRYELTISITPLQLQQLGLTMPQVAARIRQATLDLPGGKLQTSGGDILIRTKERRYTAEEYAQIPLFQTPTGTLRLGDVATITDGFEESDRVDRFNGKPAERILVYRVGNETPTQVSQGVREVISQLQKRLPTSVEAKVLFDRSIILQDRIDLLMNNLWMGLALVFLVLALFLEIGLSFWIMLGIPISFAGAFVLLPQLGGSINMLSLFAFILVLGLVVDDAIVVGENIYSHQERGEPGLKAAVEGTLEIGPPVLITILTTIAAFFPMYMIPGTTGKFFGEIPDVVVAVLLFSLAEAILIMPAHLSHPTNRFLRIVLWPFDIVLRWPRRGFTACLRWFVNKPYRKTLTLFLQYRYATLAFGVVSIMLCAGFVIGGHLRFTFFPRVDTDVVFVTARMPFGTPASVTARVEKRLLNQVQVLLQEYKAEKGKEVADGILSTLGQGGSHVVRVLVFLKPLNERGFASTEFSRKWRTSLGRIPGLESINFRASTGFGSDSDVDLQLSHTDPHQLELIAAQVREELAEYPGVSNIEDSSDSGKREVQLKVNAAGLALGLTAQEVTQQVRAAFQGLEVLKILRGGDEVRVVLRLPKTERDHLPDLENLVILTPSGQRAVLGEVTRLQHGQSYSRIRRVDGRRVMNVTANVDTKTSNTEELVRTLKRDFLPKLKADHPLLHATFEGGRRNQFETFAGIWTGVPIALLIIYSLLALQFRSYFQPLIVMAAIPFGLVGAVLGHLLLGYNLSIVSALGLLALTGIVVNDSLILVDYVNKRRNDGTPAFQAAVEGGIRRFRPILLTSLTTFFGLLPMIFEQSLQARFIVPMAIGLAFGVLFATVIILVLIPVLYLILEDFHRLYFPGSTGQKKFTEDAVAS
ncbi:MAG: acriflavin resistance protein [Deltaproteobacteria bacterium]|nr:acriflavin resistance protein [Deltaproteobacteria bacterium]